MVPVDPAPPVALVSEPAPPPVPVAPPKPAPPKVAGRCKKPAAPPPREESEPGEPEEGNGEESRNGIRLAPPVLGPVLLGNPRPLDPKAAGGRFTAKSHVLEANRDMVVTKDLTVIATDGDIRIKGRIIVVPRGVVVPRVTLCAPKGSIIIEKVDAPTRRRRLRRRLRLRRRFGVLIRRRLERETGIYGGKVFEASTDEKLRPDLRQLRNLRRMLAASAKRTIAQGAGGTNAAPILLQAQEIEILGTVKGMDGGDGGFARCVGPLGESYATGGQAGAGGDVVLCATDAIKIADSATVQAGACGAGGDANARGGPGTTTVSEGGPGHEAGDVRFEGHDAARKCNVQLAGTVTGGAGGEGGGARAEGAAIVSIPGIFGNSGGAARSTGGKAGPGGDVEFVNCNVNVLAAAKLAGGAGGTGGEASAIGGHSRSANDGGSAASRGGDGALGGKAAGGAAGAVGRGGDAKARPGNGSRALPFALVGDSGSAQAQGGSSGDGTPAKFVQNPGDPGQPRKPGQGAKAAVESKGA